MSHPSTLLKQLSSIAETAMGGTSGALYSLMLTMAGMALEAEVEAVTARTWATALMVIEPFLSVTECFHWKFSPPLVSYVIHCSNMLHCVV